MSCSPPGGLPIRSGMERSRLGIGMLLLCGGLAAQQTPAAPAGEGKVVFTAAEAHAFAFCLDMANGLNGMPGLPPQKVGVVPGYGITPVELPALASEKPQPNTNDGAAARLLYVLPVTTGDAARRMFCVRGDGVIAFTDNVVGTAQRDGRPLEPGDVLGEGGPVSPRNFPRTPGRGQDGNLWFPGDMMKTVRMNVRVVDEAGAPFGMVQVHCVAESGAEALDVVLPAGRTRTRLEGDAVLVGVPARGLGLVLEIEGLTVPVPPADVTVEGQSVRIRAPRAAMQQARLRRNESAAIATLKNISSAQAQCQASGVIDANKNGAGEYGMFAELSGRDGVRGTDQKISPPVLSTAFSRVQGGVVVRSGYCFRMFLPDQAAVAVAEHADGGADAAAVDPAQAETMWCCYAWPVEPGVSGQRAFFINQSGDVLAMPNQDNGYGGVDKGPAASSAFQAKSTGHMNAAVAANAAGRDGAQWRVVN